METELDEVINRVQTWTEVDLSTFIEYSDLTEKLLSSVISPLDVKKCLRYISAAELDRAKHNRSCQLSSP